MQAQRLGAITLVLSMALAGCAAPETNGDDDEAWMTVTLDKRVLQVGEWVNITVTFVNRGEDPLRYDHPGCPPEPFRVDVTGAGRTFRAYTYGEEAMAGACVITNQTLQPGQQITTTVNWNGRSTENPPEPHTGGGVAPGQHVVTAELRRADEGPTFETNQTFSVAQS